MRAAAAIPTGKFAEVFVLSDVIFLGLMFNAAAIANVLSEKFAPKTYALILGLTSVPSLFLVWAFSMSFREDMPQWFLWTWVILTIVFSVVLSFFTSDSRFTVSVERILSQSDLIANLPTPLRKKARAAASAAKTDDELTLFQAVIDRYMRRLANPESAFVLRNDEKGRPALVPNLAPTPEEELDQLLTGLLEQLVEQQKQ